MIEYLLTMDELKFDTKMKDDFPKVIISEEEIQTRIDEVGKQITKDYQDKQEEGIVLMCVLKGAAIFMTDLARKIDLKVEMDFMCVSSYANELKSTGRVIIDKDVSSDITGKHIIIAEDIIDTGNTMDYLIKHLKNRGAKSVTVVALLHKHCEQKEIPCKYECFSCPNEFIVGYGLDYKQYYRNLPYISGLGE